MTAREFLEHCGYEITQTNLYRLTKYCGDLTSIDFSQSPDAELPEEVTDSAFPEADFQEYMDRPSEFEELGIEYLINPSDLIGTREAAEILNWDPRRVATYRIRGSFPEPVAELAMGPVWTRRQIEEFAKKFQPSE